MPSPSSTQDEQANPRPRTVESLFDSSPALEDTRPFSLLNALLADVPGSVHYEAPAFQVQEEPEVVDPPAGQLAAVLLKQSKSSPVPTGDAREAESNSTASADKIAKWPAAKQSKKDGTREMLVEDVDTNESTTEAGPRAFPELEGNGTPGKPKSWPKRGFVSSATRPKPSTDPLNKAIRIFESLSSSDLDKVETAPSNRGDFDTHTDAASPQTSPKLQEVASPEEVPTEALRIEPAEGTIESPVAVVEESDPEEPNPEVQEPEQIAPVGGQAGSVAPSLGDQITEPVQAREEVSPVPVVIEENEPGDQLTAPVGGIDPADQPTAAVGGIDPADQPTAAVGGIDPADQPTAAIGGIDPADQPTAPIGLKPPTIQVPTPFANVGTEDKAIDNTAANTGIDVDGDAATQPIRSRGPLAPEIAPQDQPASAWSLNAARVFLSNTETRQETVNDKVASLLDILETVLPNKGTVGGANDTSKGIATSKAVIDDSEITRPYRVPPPPKPKIQLVPRTVKGKGDFDITAPVTVVSPETPVSPFTKVAGGATREVRRSPNGPPPQTVTQRPKPPQAPAGAITAIPPAPKPAVSSPFTVIDPATKKKPPVVKETPKITPNPEFASPFSSAMRRRGENSPAVNKGPTIVAPITPPGELPGEGEELPLPTFSFSSLERVPTVPQTSAQSVSSSSTATPKPEKVVKPAPCTTTIEQEPEKPTWGFLTILLACIFVGFLLLYIIEIYKELRSPRVRMPVSIPPDAAGVIPAETNASSAALKPLADVDLNEPLEAIKAFLSAPTIEARLPFVLEDESVAEAMRQHYASFGGLDEGLPDTMAIVDGGSLPGANRAFVTARLHWKTHDPLNIRLINQEGGKHQFSWYAFVQWRHQLFAKFVTGEWAEWSHFYVEIRPSEGPSYVPDLVRSKSLWYQVGSPEYPDFTTLAGVPKDWPIAKDFAERFHADRKYEVVVELERARDEEGMILDHLTIVRLLNDSWEPAP